MDFQALRLGGVVFTKCGITGLHEAGEYHSILPINDTTDFA
jgi:hypothetical protein